MASVAKVISIGRRRRRSPSAVRRFRSADSGARDPRGRRPRAYDCRAAPGSRSTGRRRRPEWRGTAENVGAPGHVVIRAVAPRRPHRGAGRREPAQAPGGADHVAPSARRRARARSRRGSNGRRSSSALADADELHRQAELVGDRDGDAALRRAVELRQRDAGDADRLAEQPRLLEAVLARSSRRRRAASRAARPRAGASITRRTFASSSIRFVCVCRRPAVSTITTSRPRARAASIASKATAAGSPPRWRADEVGARRARPRSRAAPRPRRGTCRRRRRAPLRPCSRSFWASLPIVVVLPVPLTPTTRITVGCAVDDERRRLAEQRCDLLRERLAEVVELAARLEPAHELGRRAARRRRRGSAPPRAAPRPLVGRVEGGGRELPVSARRLLPSESRSRPKKPLLLLVRLVRPPRVAEELCPAFSPRAER